MVKQRHPARVNATQLATSCDVQIEIVRDGRKIWVPARSLGYAHWKERCRLGWAVFTGKADALFWDEQ